MTDEDYAPIAREGYVAPTPRRRLPLRGGRPGLPAAEAGRRLVVVDGNGEACLFSAQTAGDRQWRDPRAWMMVDVRPHTLAFDLHIDSPFGHAGFDVTIEVECRVSDPVVVAGDRIDGVRGRLGPAVGSAVRRVVRAAARDVRPEVGTAAEQLVFDREYVRERFDDELQAELKLDWLATTVLSVTVEFDDATAEYYRVLRGHRQDEDVIIADIHNKRVLETETEELFKERRKRMKPRVADSRTFLVELLVQDPTPARFDMVLAELRRLSANDQRQETEQFLAFANNGLLDEYPELKDKIARNLLDAIPDKPGDRVPAAAPPVQAGDASPAELPAEDDPGTVDHEGDLKTEEHRPEGGET